MSELDLAAYISDQREWSQRTFGEGQRTVGITEHIRKELAEIVAHPDDVTEWIDVVILALDGAWRHGASPEQIVKALLDKQRTNFARCWQPVVDENTPSEHVREVHP